MTLGERDGTPDQLNRFFFPVLDAVRIDRDYHGSVRTVAFHPRRTRSLFGTAQAGLFESCHIRYPAALGSFFQGLNLWLMNTLL